VRAERKKGKKGKRENVITRFGGYVTINSDVRSEFMICRQCSQGYTSCWETGAMLFIYDTFERMSKGRRVLIVWPKGPHLFLLLG
jgi:hypothetical protein